jgi:ABC-type branched-subunit amino acid transport system ATPase component
MTAVLNPAGMAQGPHMLLIQYWRRKRTCTASSDSHAAPEAIEAGGPAPESGPSDPDSLDQVPADSRDARRRESHSVLEVSDVSVSFGGVHANQHVSLVVNAGEVVGLIGPNGAGKTTLIDAISGTVRSTGSVVCCGEMLSELPSYQRARSGLRRTFQAIDLYEDLDVEGHLRVAVSPRLAATNLSQAGNEQVNWTLAEFGLTEVRSRYPEELSFAQRRMLGIARAVVSEPPLVILDEAAAALGRTERVTFAEHIRRLTARGVGILLVEHDFELVSSVCDRIYVLVDGRMLVEGTPSEVRAHPEVIRAYLGVSTEPAPGADEHLSNSLAPKETL